MPSATRQAFASSPPTARTSVHCSNRSFLISKPERNPPKPCHLNVRKLFIGYDHRFGHVLLRTDRNLYASLFDFVEPWKIDILDYLNENYMLDLSMNEIASYTGRSLATFKRDFAKVSDLPPQKWIIKRRLEAARDLILSGKKKVTEACFDVGFKNLSHFSKIYKEAYGVAPSWR